MAKVCFLLAVLCGLASINVSFAEPSTMYGAAPAAKYPAPAAPATYPAAPAKYEAPALPPAPAKYEAPAPPAPPAPAKYEVEKPKYEEMKKEEYPMKMEYKKEEKMEYPSMKMPEYGGKKYRRSIIEDDEEEEVQSDPFRPFRPPFLNAVRDAVIMKLLSENDPRFLGSLGRGFAKEGAGVLGSLIGSKIGGDPFSTVNDPRIRGGKLLGQVGANLAGGVLGGLLGDERACGCMGWSKKQARLMRDAIVFAAENDPRFGKTFGKEFAKGSAGGLGTLIGSKIRGGDPFSMTVQDLVEMYGRDPVRRGGKGKFAGQLAGSLAGGVLGGLADDMDF